MSDIQKGNPHQTKGQFRFQPVGHQDYQLYLNMMASIKALGETPYDLSDPAQVRARIDDYFRIMYESTCRPSVAGLAMAMGMSRQTLTALKTGKFSRNGKYKGVTDDVIAEIARGYQQLEVLYESYMMNDDINPMVGVFIGTNHYGYRNASAVDINTDGVNDTEKIDAESIREKYKLVADDRALNSKNDDGEDD